MKPKYSLLLRASRYAIFNEPRLSRQAAYKFLFPSIVCTNPQPGTEQLTPDITYESSSHNILVKLFLEHP